MIRRFFSKLKRSLSWFIFAWDNNDYDYYYFYETMSKKLKDMVIYFQKNARHTNTGRVIKLMKICIKLIEHITPGTDWSECEDLYSLLHKKYGEIKYDFVPINKEYSKLNTIYMNTPIEKQEYVHRLSSKIFKKSEYRKNWSKKRLFYILSKYIDYFWE
jgi:hypothetical protein